MAGTFTIKNLGDGRLPATTGILYTVPALTQTIIKTITLVNTDSATRAVNLFLKPSGTNRRIIPKDLSLGAGFSLETDRDYTLEAGDTIKGDASLAVVVEFTINGIEET